MTDLISRQAAIDAIGKASDELYENIKKGATFPQRQWFDGMAQAQSILENLPSAQPEPLTDKEQRIFLAAMGREEKVCKQVDEECECECEISLVHICHEIIRKVKDVLWA